MTPTKLLMGQIPIALAAPMLRLWKARQWAAGIPAHAPELASSFYFARVPLYSPCSLLVWRWRDEAHAPDRLDRAKVPAGFSAGTAGALRPFESARAPRAADAGSGLPRPDAGFLMPFENGSGRATLRWTGAGAG